MKPPSAAGVVLATAANAVPSAGQNPAKALKPRVPPEWKNRSRPSVRRTFHTRQSPSPLRGSTSRRRWTSASAAASGPAPVGRSSASR